MKINCNNRHFVGISGPQPTYLVTVADSEKDTTDIIAVEWATPLSVNPPLFGIVVSQNKNSHDMIKKAGVFTVNIPSVDIAKEMYWAGSHTGRKYKDKIAESGLTSRPGKINANSVSLEEAVGYFECKVVNEVKIGNNVMFIGEVQAAVASGDLFDTEKGMWYPDKLHNIYRVAHEYFVTNSTETLAVT